MEERGTLGLVYLDVGGEGAAEPLHGLAGLRRGAAAASPRCLALKGEGILGPRDIVAVLGVRSDKFLVFLRGHESLPFETAALAGPRAPAAGAAGGGAGRPPPADGRGARRLPRGPRPHVPRPHAARRALHPPRAGRGHVHEPAPAHARGGPARPAPGRDHRGRPDRHPLPAHPRPAARARCSATRSSAAGPPGGPFEEAEQLFALAERTGRLVDLERLCRRRALASAHAPPQAGHQALPQHLGAAPCATPRWRAPRSCARWRGRASGNEDVVLEITERVALEERQPYREVLRDLKRQGFGIAIDDMGAGYSSLQRAGRGGARLPEVRHLARAQHRPQPHQAQPAGDAGGPLGEDRSAGDRGGHRGGAGAHDRCATWACAWARAASSPPPSSVPAEGEVRG